MVRFCGMNEQTSRTVLPPWSSQDVCELTSRLMTQTPVVPGKA